MRSHEIENWVLSVIDRVERRLPNEDSRVELKSEWIDPQRVARQIAAHANAARGDPILWIIGADQQRGIVGANHEELANWFAQVKAQFDGLAPQLTDLNVPVKSGALSRSSSKQIAPRLLSGTRHSVNRAAARSNLKFRGVKIRVPEARHDLN